MFVVVLSYVHQSFAVTSLYLFLDGRKAVHEAMTPVHVARSRKHPIWVVYAAAGLHTAHICMDAGEFRLSAGGRAAAVTAAC